MQVIGLQGKKHRARNAAYPVREDPEERGRYDGRRNRLLDTLISEQKPHKSSTGVLSLQEGSTLAKFVLKIS